DRGDGRNSLGRVGVWSSQIRKCARSGRGRLVDAVADARTTVGVDDQRVQGVDHVVVQRPAATGRVRPTLQHRTLDLEVAVFGVRFVDVYDQKVGEQQFRQRVRSVWLQGPVELTV